MIYLTSEDIEHLCYDYAKTHLAYDEPLPPFELRDPNQLERALFAPQREVNGTPIYQRLSEKAAVLFYEMIKLHPFFNGNKRVACVALMTFLFFNGKWMKAPWISLYRVAMRVAESNPRDRNDIIKTINKTIEENLRPA